MYSEMREEDRSITERRPFRQPPNFMPWLLVFSVVCVILGLIYEVLFG